jgi:hypothetical protein
MTTQRPQVQVAGVLRDMTDEEFEQYQKDQAEFERIKQAKAEAAAKRQALLDKLGITEEEAKLLLG